MPIPNIIQPDIIPISPTLRLRKYDGNYLIAMPWYEDKNTLMMVNGNDEPYTPERMKKMYDYLNAKGEEYFIEVLPPDSGAFLPIGDVTFWPEDMPIVLGDLSYRGQGIAKQVILALLDRARSLGFEKQYVEEIYTFNVPSTRLFMSCGFTRLAPTEKGYSYVCDLTV